MPMSRRNFRLVTRLIGEDLTVDGVATVHQLMRRYSYLGITRDKAREAARRVGGKVFHPRIRPTARSSERPRCEVWYSHPIQPASSVLPHLLGLAEVRSMLTYRATSWSYVGVLPSKTRKQHTSPDALVEIPDLGVTVFEYDHGRYTSEVIRAKAEHARTLSRFQVWCTPSLRHADLISSIVPDAEVWLVSWYTGKRKVISDRGYLKRAMWQAGAGSEAEELASEHAHVGIPDDPDSWLL